MLVTSGLLQYQRIPSCGGRADGRTVGVGGEARVAIKLYWFSKWTDLAFSERSRVAKLASGQQLVSYLMDVGGPFDRIT